MSPQSRLLDHANARRLFHGCFQEIALFHISVTPSIVRDDGSQLTKGHVATSLAVSLAAGRAGSQLEIDRFRYPFWRFVPQQKQYLQ